MQASLAVVSSISKSLHSQTAGNAARSRIYSANETFAFANLSTPIVRIGATLDNPPYNMECLFNKAGCPRMGSAVEITIMLMQVLGLSYVFRVVRDGQWGTYSNETGWNGLVKDLLEEEIDLTLPILRPSTKRMEVVSASRPAIRRANLAFLVNRAIMERPMRSILSIDVAVCLCLVAAVGLIKVAQPWLIVCAGRLLPSLFHLTVKHSKALRGNRMLPIQALVLIAALGLLVSSNFIGEFAITRSRAPFSGIQDHRLPDLLIRRELRWISMGRSTSFFLDLDTIPENAELKNALHEQPPLIVGSKREWLRMIAKQQDLITYHDADAMLYMIAQNGSQLGDFQVVTHPNTVRYGTCMMMRQRWPHLSALNHAILWLDEAGLTEKISRDYSGKYSGRPSRDVEEKRNSRSLTKRSIALRNLEVLFYTWMSAVAVAVLSFVFELLTHNAFLVVI